jgi:pimeloyl-ACP methyl ester carboxylesterase
MSTPAADEVLIDCGFVQVGDRSVHYMKAGDGPIVVLAHAYPGSAAHLRPRMRLLAHRFTCYAFDAPGFGKSDPLHIRDATVVEITDDLAAAMRALKIPRAAIFGWHSGAVVGLELGVRHPELVSGLVLDGLPVFTADELASTFEGYFPDVPIDASGSHFAWAWIRMRDQCIWFPWHHRSKGTIRADLSFGVAPNVTNAMMLDFFQCTKSYKAAYHSTVFYGQNGIESAAALTRPAIFFEAMNDVAPHLDRLPPLKPGQELQRLKLTAEEKSVLIEEGLTRFQTQDRVPAYVDTFANGARIARHLIGPAGRKIHIRNWSTRQRSAIVLLHNAPGSSLALEPLIRRLGPEIDVYAIDLPGCAESDALTADRSIADYADAVAGACASIGLQRINLYGTGVGASVAIEVKTRHPAIVDRLILHGILLPSDPEREELLQHYAPKIAIQANGTHWFDTWMMLRDSQIWWPWYNRNPEAMRRIDGDFSAEHLQAWTLEVMKQSHAYHHVIQAALRHRADKALSNLTGPVLLCEDADHIFAAYSGRAAAAAPHAVSVKIGNSENACGAAIMSFINRPV